MKNCRLALCPSIAIVITLFLLTTSQPLSSACLDGDCNQDCKPKDAYCFAYERGYYYSYNFADNQCSTLTQAGVPAYPNSCYRHVREATICIPDCSEDSQDHGGVGEINKYSGYISSTTTASINTSCLND